MKDAAIRKNERLIRNEQLIRDKNMAAGQGIKKYFHADQDVRQTPIAFLCECSMLDCDQNVNVSIDAYLKLHARRDHFLIFPGHETESIEKTVAHQDSFDIVEKYEVPK
jgi:hypothetical protein